MELTPERLIYQLDPVEIDMLLHLYYQAETNEEIFSTDSEQEVLHQLVEKNLISTSIEGGKNIITLTDDGLQICGSVMFNRLKEKTPLFHEKMQALPQRAISSFVNRILWKEVSRSKQNIFESQRPEQTENIPYEQVLLHDGRLQTMFDHFLTALESLEFVETVDGQKLCSPEVESFLIHEYSNVPDLYWTEEDSLKYYLFFYVYAKGQKNLIDFSGEGEAFYSHFYGEEASPYFISLQQNDPRNLLSALDIAEARVIAFLQDMVTRGVVSERKYPISTTSYFSDDRLFVISDIKKYMGFITEKFLTPVVDSLLKKM